eukprot:3618701-Prymnesium_polylepis.2
MAEGRHALCAPSSSSTQASERGARTGASWAGAVLHVYWPVSARTERTQRPCRLCGCHIGTKW